jgi:hypothetical protein
VPIAAIHVSQISSSDILALALPDQWLVNPVLPIGKAIPNPAGFASRRDAFACQSEVAILTYSLFRITSPVLSQ